MKIKNAVAYVRVSTEEQAKKGYSIKAQIDKCEEFAKREGYNIVKIFVEEGKSAKDLNRPELKKMIAYCKIHHIKIKGCIFWKWDRMSRGKDSDYVKLYEFFDECEIKPLSVEETNEDNPEANLMRKISFATSAYELDKDSQRTKLGLKRKAEEGHYPSRAPIGYLNKRDTNDRGFIEVDANNAFYVKRAFTYYSTGLYSLESLGKKMFSEGFKNKHGKAYPARKFEEILKNPFYIGKFKWNGQLYEGKHTPLISKELFYNVQNMFGKTNKPKYNNKVFTYGKFITCAECGCYFTAEQKKGAHKSGSYIYYHCTNKKNIHLKQKNITEEQLNEAVQEILDSIYVPEDIIKSAKNSVIANLNELYEAENQATEYRLARIKDLDSMIKKSYEDRLLGKLPISEEMYQKQNREWQEERDTLIIDVKESKDINKRIYNNIDLIINFCNKLPQLYLNASTEDKQLILRTLIDEITYANGELTVKLKPVFERLRLIKSIENASNLTDKVRTLKPLKNQDIADNLTSEINTLIAKRVRTLKTKFLSIKNAPEGANFETGASNVLLLDPEFIINLKNTVSTAECEYCLYKLSKISA